MSLPKELNLSDLDRLLQSDALFARKFHGTRSRALRDRLEAHFQDDGTLQLTSCRDDSAAS